MADPVQQLKDALKNVKDDFAPDQVRDGFIRAIDKLDLTQDKKNVLVQRFQQQLDKALGDGKLSTGDVKHLKEEALKDVVVIKDMKSRQPAANAGPSPNASPSAGPDPVQQLRDSLKGLKDDSTLEETRTAFVKAIGDLNLEPIKKAALVQSFQQEFGKALGDGKFTPEDVRHLKEELLKDTEVIKGMKVGQQASHAGPVEAPHQPAAIQPAVYVPADHPRVLRLPNNPRVTDSRTEPREPDVRKMDPPKLDPAIFKIPPSLPQVSPIVVPDVNSIPALPDATSEPVVIKSETPVPSKVEIAAPLKIEPSPMHADLDLPDVKNLVRLQGSTEKISEMMRDVLGAERAEKLNIAQPDGGLVLADPVRQAPDTALPGQRQQFAAVLS